MFPTFLFILFFGITILGMMGMFAVAQWRPEVRGYGVESQSVPTPHH